MASHDRRFSIESVRSATDLKDVTTLFRAYASSLAIDLAFQDFEAEMDAMPGKYSPPLGRLLLARDHRGEAVGCVGLRPIAPEGCCEMKRLYVSPEGRGFGLGRMLVGAVLEEATRIGYREMRLDTPSVDGRSNLALYASRFQADRPVLRNAFSRDDFPG